MRKKTKNNLLQLGDPTSDEGPDSGTVLGLLGLLVIPEQSSFMAQDASSPVRAKLVLVTLRNQVIFPLFRSAFEVNKRSFEQAQILIDQKKADGLGAIALRNVPVFTAFKCSW
eukprot:s3843_g2.t1